MHEARHTTSLVVTRRAAGELHAHAVRTKRTVGDPGVCCSAVVAVDLATSAEAGCELMLMAGVRTATLVSTSLWFCVRGKLLRISLVCSLI